MSAGTARKARQRVAAATRGQARAAAERARQVERGEVVRANPLTIKLSNHPVTLGPEDYDISHEVAQFIARYGLEEGDTLLLAFDEDWLVFGVSDHDERDHVDLINVGDEGDHAIDKDAGTWHFKGTLAAYDVNGKLIGRIPLI